MTIRRRRVAHVAPLALGRRVAMVIAALLTIACSSQKPPVESPEPDARQAIRSVLAQDTELGTIRNQASETVPLAEAVQDYVRGLAEIDFSACPTDFADAFERHREAWHRSAPYFEQHAELRGEMHDLFDSLREQGGAARQDLEALERDIWGTWAEVEAAVEGHDAAN